MSDRLENEIKHGKYLTSDPEGIWNWSSPAGQFRANRRASLFVESAKINKEDIVLEIGCGTGLFTKKVHELTGATITATDISEDLLQIARQAFSKAEFVIDDAMNLSFNDSKFDVVFGSSVLHHLEMEKALSEIFRVLKPGGRMVFAEPNMINPQILIQKNIPFIKKWLGDSPDETAIIRWKLKAMLERIGFIDVKIKPYDFVHPIVPKSLISTVQQIGLIIENTPILKEIAGSVIIYCKKPTK